MIGIKARMGISKCKINANYLIDEILNQKNSDLLTKFFNSANRACKEDTKKRRPGASASMYRWLRISR